MTDRLDPDNPSPPTQVHDIAVRTALEMINQKLDSLSRDPVFTVIVATANFAVAAGVDCARLYQLIKDAEDLGDPDDPQPLAARVREIRGLAKLELLRRFRKDSWKSECFHAAYWGLVFATLFEGMRNMVGW